MNARTVKFGDSASVLRANGYAVAPVTPGESQPRGAWAVIQVPYHLNAERHAEDDVAVFTHVPPPRGPSGIMNVRDTWLVALALDAKAEAAIASRLGTSPVRIASDGSTLRPFKLEGEPFSALQSPHSRIWSAAGVFLVNGNDDEGQPYVWKHGDLLTTPRKRLSTLNIETARAMHDEIVAALDRGSEAA